MNGYEWLRRQAEKYREFYPPGTRVFLLDMKDSYAPVLTGARGTVAWNASKNLTLYPCKTVLKWMQQTISNMVFMYGSDQSIFA